MSEETITEGRTAQSERSVVPRHGPRPRWLLPLLTAVLAVAAAFAAFAFVHHTTGGGTTGSTTAFGEIRVSGIPADVSTRLATLMGLQPVPRKTAPGFTLTDQDEKTLSLSSFRGHTVVLTFMDPRCRTICPIVSQELVDAEHRLARTDPGVVFAAVNVNEHALAVATTAAFTREQRLSTIPTWHFFTGSLSTLHRIWGDYGVEVATKVVNGKRTLITVIHSNLVYFIAPNGTERYLAAPNADYAKTKTHRAYLPAGTLSAWGKGIALVAAGLSH